MKKILGVLLINLFFFSTGLRSQVTVESFPMNPQSGSHNYFGVRVTLAQTYTENVTVTGYIYDMGGGANTNNPFSLTITAGNLIAETAANFYQTDPTATAETALGTIATVYAGVTVTFLANENILKFNSTLDANAVLDQLDNDYEAHNTNYENQYPTLTAEQLDDMDIQTGFDQFKTFRDFENLFTGYSSKRVEIENTEIVWLQNNFSGTNPDDIDLTFDNAENTIFNNNYSFKIGENIYQLTSSGLYINGVNQDDGGNSGIMNKSKDIMYAMANYYDLSINSGPMRFDDDKTLQFSNCKTNKKSASPPLTLQGTNRHVVLKVAIHSIGVSSSIKCKVVHFKLKNGNPKRTRANIAVRVDGIVRGTVCSLIDAVERNDPPTVGLFRKRSELRARAGDCCTIWRTFQGDVVGSFTMQEGFNDILALTW